MLAIIPFTLNRNAASVITRFISRDGCVTTKQYLYALLKGHKRTERPDARSSINRKIKPHEQKRAHVLPTNKYNAPPLSFALQFSIRLLPLIEIIVLTLK